MPTGYTYKIKDGQSFEEFAMGCARAFGACITMRDDPSDTPIPDEFKPSDYHLRGIESSAKELGAIRMMTIKEAEEKAVAAYKAEHASMNRAISDAKMLRTMYQKMIDKVRSWNPPSKKHIEFRDFMIKQLTESMDHDCDVGYYEREKANIKQLTGARYKSLHAKSAADSIKYHKREYRKEVKSCAGRTKWVNQLRRSLGIK